MTPKATPVLGTVARWPVLHLSLASRPVRVNLRRTAATTCVRLSVVSRLASLEQHFRFAPKGGILTVFGMAAGIKLHQHKSITNC